MFDANDITLYVPCFNAESTLDVCLNGIRSQTIRPKRMLLIDDGSASPVSRPEFETVRHPENRGLGSARNTALHTCETALLAALDADVAPEPDWLEQILNTMNREQADGVGGRLEEHFSDTTGDRWRAVHMAQHWGDRLARNPRFLYGANTLFRTDRLRAAGGYDPALRSNNEDRVMCDALRAQGGTLVYTPDAHCRHWRRDTEESILPGYWRWHRPVGEKRGDFDAPAGLLGRIEKVNFGIYRYRSDLDRQAERPELLPLDAALPWVFCALDLCCYRQRTGQPAPVFPPPDLLERAAGPMAKRLRQLLAFAASETESKPNPSWTLEYHAAFAQALVRFGWKPEEARSDHSVPSVYSSESASGW